MSIPKDLNNIDQATLTLEDIRLKANLKDEIFRLTKEINDITDFADREIEFTGDIHKDRTIIQGVRKSMIQHAKNLIKKLPEKFKNEAVQENVYYHMEDPSLPLTADEMEFRDKYVIPLKEAQQKIFLGVHSLFYRYL